ncbi:MAG: TIGR03790 family protein [Chthoniobacterales bacterium]
MVTRLARFLAVGCAAAVLLGCDATTWAEVPLAPATVVVFNSSVPESVELAKFYAQKRGIALDHLIGLRCAREEEISRENYDTTIRDPLREIFRKRGWWQIESGGDRSTITTGTIYFVALIKGMPLKIRPTEAYPGDKVNPGPLGNRNDASVDSELAMLARVSPEISGAVVNPYFQSYRAVTEVQNAPFLLVCRLDAPSVGTVRQMITDGIEAERNGLWGRAYVDGAHNTGGGLEVGDRWLSEIPAQLRKIGVPVVYDNEPAIFPEGYPMSDCALYYGWYAAGVAGPFAQPSFRFTRGAVAVHIHSFSASTLRDPAANWVGPLLTKGAAASIGNVYEPYLQLTTNLSVFNDRLVHGFTFAESAYMATPALSWMAVMVGDPLYRPYASALQIDVRRAQAAGGSDWKSYRDFAAQNTGQPEAEFRTLARQAASRAKNGPMIEDLGMMEAEAGKWASATTYFQQARSIYTKRDDILRATLEESNGWAKQGNKKRALDAVRGVLRIVSDPATVALFKAKEAELSPPPPLQASPTKP